MAFFPIPAPLIMAVLLQGRAGQGRRETPLGTTTNKTMPVRGKNNNVPPSVSHKPSHQPRRKRRICRETFLKGGFFFKKQELLSLSLSGEEFPRRVMRVNNVQPFSLPLSLLFPLAAISIKKNTKINK